jgi:hypothetical protein
VNVVLDAPRFHAEHGFICRCLYDGDVLESRKLEGFGLLLVVVFGCGRSLSEGW